MKCLPEISRDAALSGLPFSRFYERPLGLELHLTEIHKEFEDAPPAVRELEVLKVQLPASLQPIQCGDLFAGRILYPMVSFGPEPGGLGYACRSDVIREVLAEQHFESQEREEVLSMLDYWVTRTTSAKVRARYSKELSAILPTDDWQNASGIAFPLYRMAGTVLDYAKLLRLGISGLKQEIEKAQRGATAAQKPFLEAAAGAMELLRSSCATYALEARELLLTTNDAIRCRDLERLVSSLESLCERPPSTMHEAIQLVWLYALHSGTWNYGRADAYLGSFLARDLEANRLDHNEALRLLESWWRLMKAYDNQYNNRVIIGGRGRSNERDADAFALMAIEATRRVKLNQPQLSLRFYKGQNPVLMQRALNALSEGTTFPMLYNDDVNVPAVAAAFDVPGTEAEQYHPYGCGEYVLANRSVGSPNGVINLVKCLDSVLHQGVTSPTNDATGLRFPPPSAFQSFEQLWTAYAGQLECHLRALAQQERLEYAVTGEEAPFLFISALYDDCLARREPVFSGGVRYLGGTVETYGNVNVADALHSIDQLVFKQRRYSLAEIVEACDGNFETIAHAELRKDLLRVPKFGNDDPGADAMLIRVHEHVCRAARNLASEVGLHSYLVVIINNWCNVVFGAVTPASADGRRFGDTFANANNPAPGSDRNGTTAFLNSLAKPNPAVHAGAVQNMKFSRDFFRNSRAKLEALLQVYWQRGGTQAMITVVSPEDLLAAMKEPEKWGHLMVRVGGFSARFIDLPKGAQLEILSRTCH